MGTLIFLAVVVWGVFMGIVLFSLLSMAKRTDRLDDRMELDEEMTTPADTYYQPASETLSLTSSGEARPQGVLGASVAAP